MAIGAKLFGLLLPLLCLLLLLLLVGTEGTYSYGGDRPYTTPLGSSPSPTPTPTTPTTPTIPTTPTTPTAPNTSSPSPNITTPTTPDTSFPSPNITTPTTPNTSSPSPDISTPTTPKTPSPSPDISTPTTPNTPSSTPYSSTPIPTPTTPNGSSPSINIPHVIIPDSPTPTTPSYGYAFNPKRSGKGTCKFWRSNTPRFPNKISVPTTLSGIFGGISNSHFGSKLTIVDALINDSNDSYSALARHGVASLLNSYMVSNFIYSPEQVKKQFNQALVTPESAAQQALLFERANELI